MYITTFDDLVSFCEYARTQTVLAVDTEFLRERTYYPRLCLLQLGTEKKVACIDPLAIDNLSPVVQLFEDDKITKVFHACSQDLEVINHTLHCIPKPLFDTQIAATFLGHRIQIGYSTLVEAYTDVRLPKSASLTDWSKRPLDAEQLNYAADDVRYTPGIYRTMMDELTRSGRLSWLMPELHDLLDPTRYRHDAYEAYKHVKRVSSLTRRQLAIAREVCAWREKRAEKRNCPRKWVLGDEIVLEICKCIPQTTQRLRKIRGTEQLSERDSNELVRAVKKGQLCPPEECPKLLHRARPSAELEGVLDLMYALLRHVSESSGVATQVIATRDDLYLFMTDPAHSRLSCGWRKDLVGDLLTELLSGEIGLTVKSGRVEFL